MPLRPFRPGGAPQAPRIVVVMGVSGSGKSTVGTALARRLGWTFVDGDGFHTPEHVASMRSGLALSEADRAPWLAAIGAWIGARLDAGGTGVVACSALRRVHREVLAAGRREVGIVYLKGDEALIAARIGARTGHFMPAGLLASQFAALEEPGPGEDVLSVAIEGTPDAVAADIAHRLGLAPARTGEGP